MIKQLPGVVVAALVVIVAMITVRECGYRDGAKNAVAAQRDLTDNKTIARMAAEQFATEAQHARDTATLRAELRTLRARMIPTAVLVSQAAPNDTLVSQLAVRDSVIAGLDSALAISDGQARFWKSQAVAWRDTLGPRLVQARDAWRKQAERPRYTVTDIGGGAIAGWGLAQKNETAVLVGAGVILLPRVWGSVKRIL